MLRSLNDLSHITRVSRAWEELSATSPVPCTKDRAAGKSLPGRGGQALRQRTGSAGLSHRGQAGNIPQGWQPPAGTSPCTSPGDVEPLPCPVTTPE